MIYDHTHIYMDYPRNNTKWAVFISKFYQCSLKLFKLYDFYEHVFVIYEGELQIKLKSVKLFCFGPYPEDLPSPPLPSPSLPSNRKLGNSSPLFHMQRKIAMRHSAWETSNFRRQREHVFFHLPCTSIHSLRNKKSWMLADWSANIGYLPSQDINTQISGTVHITISV